MPKLISRPAPSSRRHLLRLGWLVLLVSAVHAWLIQELPLARLGEGASEGRPQRFQVELRRELAPVAVPARAGGVAPAAPARAPGRVVPQPPAVVPTTLPDANPEAVAAAASAAETETASTRPVPAPAPEPAPAPAALTGPDSAAPVVASAASATSAAAAPAFEWPPSTRLTYRLSGNYQGPVEGQAQVEWLRSGGRYQVHMTVSVGPSFAPLLSRRITSEGDITEQGLRPRRYDEETKALFREPRRLAIAFDADSVRLPSGQTLPRPEGVQDSASQFVQLTWLFIQNPDWLQTGRSIDVPLALPRQVQTWTYDVLLPETLYTPAGPVATVHVKPRRGPGTASTTGRTGGELAAEIWVAPSLQHLPVRIVIRQDAENFIDLLLDRLPQQAEPGR